MDIRNKLIKKETDTVPNFFAAQAMGYVGFTMVVIEALNEWGVFNVTVDHMRWMAALVFMCSLFAEFLGRTVKYAENPSTKYVIMGAVLVSLAISMLCLEHWAGLALFVPMLIALQYASQKLTWMACAGTGIIALFSAPVSCALSLWQVDYLQFLTNAAGYEAAITPIAEPNTLEMFFRVMLYIGFPRFMMAVAFSFIVFLMTNRAIKNLSARAEQTDLSHIDTLTQMFSRLSYEEQMDTYKSKPPKSLICLYADVNGLHETNNTLGHGEGDILLRNCAAALYNTFGPCVYRIGGDEFVVLSEENCNLLMRVKQIEDILEEYECSMAIGSSRMQEGEDISTLVRRCEQLMYAAKKAHYKKLGNAPRR